MKSAVYAGSVRHRRFIPILHNFRHRIAMAYIDLAELHPSGPLENIVSQKRRSYVHFDRSDYFGDPAEPLDTCIRNFVEQRTTKRPPGPIRMLTHLRTAGWNFNPITIYYCFEEDDVTLGAVVFEITNTPWGERCAYVALPNSEGKISNIAMQKEMHVSPMMPMDMEYRFSCGAPDNRCFVRFELWRNDERYFDADLWCGRLGSLDRRTLRVILLRYPLMPLLVSFEIYAEFVRLFAKRVPFLRHPETTSGSTYEIDHRTRRKVS